MRAILGYATAFFQFLERHRIPNPDFTMKQTLIVPLKFGHNRHRWTVSKNLCKLLDS